jgi:hypothetical protein
MKVRIGDGDIHLLDTRTRLPFRYGIATMTSAPHLFLRLHVEVDGRLSSGITADGLPPKWFTKEPARPIADEIEEMLRVIEQALHLAVGVEAESPFDAWLQVYRAQSSWGKSKGLPPLLTQFGASLVERALLEAVCRAADQPFCDLLRADAFGIRLGDIHPLLAGRQLGELLQVGPVVEITVRHTIGLLDPLTDAEIPPAERLDDGLPQSLAASIDHYGLRHFKIKVCGDPDRDLPRLRRVAEVIDTHAVAPHLQETRARAPSAPADLVERTVRQRFGFSLDGNEQFHRVDDFRSFWDAVQGDPVLAPFFASHLRFVEQPFHRDIALDPDVVQLRAWPERPPIIIDESDAEMDSLPRALDLGYAGTTHKNCKGVFKSVASACLLWHIYRQEPRRRLFFSGEDLANIGPVALLQDLAVCAALGISSVERNGHHYFAGLSMFPDDVQKQVLKHHPDLYRSSRDGWPTLNIRNGVIDISSILKAPFGVGFAMPLDRFETPAAWRRSHPRF